MTVAFGKTVNPNLIKLIIRPLSIEGSQVSHLDWLNFLTQLAAVTPRYQEGSFTAGTTGCTGATGTIEFRICGNLAFITIPATILGVAAGTSFSITGVPSILTPLNSPTIHSVGCLDNSGSTTTTNMTFAAGVWTLGNTLNGGTSGWNAAGNRGILAQTFVFPLN